MKVALYPSHHNLPFWHSPSNPSGMFDQSAFIDWRYASIDWGDEGRRYKFVPIAEHWLTPVLEGLFALKIRRVMAHVSVELDFENKILVMPHRIWVQITTMPKAVDEKGLPIVVKDGKVLVEHMWGGDNGTYCPLQLLGKELGKGENTPELWADFFLDKLRKSKACAVLEFDEARRNLKKYAFVP